MNISNLNELTTTQRYPSMSRSAVELDFFALEKLNSSNSPSSDRRSPIRGFQSKLSRIKPELIRSAIAAASPTAPTPPPLPVASAGARSASENLPVTAPLTIFYNGSVAVFDLPADKAEAIIKVAEEGCGVNAPPVLGREPGSLLDKRDELPVGRKRSLRHFLERRKERLTSMAPYACDEHMGSKKKVRAIMATNTPANAWSPAA